MLANKQILTNKRLLMHKRMLTNKRILTNKRLLTNKRIRINEYEKNEETNTNKRIGIILLTIVKLEVVLTVLVLKALILSLVKTLFKSQDTISRDTYLIHPILIDDIYGGQFFGRLTILYIQLIFVFIE